MLLVAMLATALSTVNPSPTPPSSIARCLDTMDGSIYHGDPSDRSTLKADVAVCLAAVAQAQRIPVTVGEGPGKLFLVARLLDRTATLSFMGLNDPRTALREVSTANCYFRILAGLGRQSSEVHDAALANVALTTVQLQTLHSDIAAAGTARGTAQVALRPKHRADAP